MSQTTLARPGARALRRPAAPEAAWTDRPRVTTLAPEDDYRPRHAAPSPMHRPDSPAPAPAPAPHDGPATRALRLLLDASTAAVAARLLADPAGAGRVRVASPAPDAPLVVHDEGAGLSPRQVRALLAASLTGTDLLAAGDLDGLGDLLRACLAVAERVELRSRSALHPDAATLNVVVRADGTVRVALAGPRLPDPGTEVRVHLTAEHRGALDAGALPDVVRRLTSDAGVTVDGHRVAGAVAPTPAAPGGRPLPGCAVIVATG